MYALCDCVTNAVTLWLIGLFCLFIYVYCFFLAAYVSNKVKWHNRAVADLGGVRGVRPHPPLASFKKIQGLPVSKIVRTADSTIIIITNFCREIFLRKW